MAAAGRRGSFVSCLFPRSHVFVFAGRRLPNKAAPHEFSDGMLHRDRRLRMGPEIEAACLHRPPNLDRLGGQRSGFDGFIRLRAAS